ncbi:Aldolase [Azospirillaceae bacterium]
MTTEIRTFRIADTDEDYQDEQERLAAFLRSVEVERIDTAYADGAWRILVLYQDLRRKEESAQIESAIVAALGSWRNKTSRRMPIEREELLPSSLLGEIARLAPSTERELSTINGIPAETVKNFGSEIVLVVKGTLDDLID